LINKFSIPNLVSFEISYMVIKMNMDLLQTRFMAPLGTIGGAAVGSMVDGPAGMVTGAKLGACVGTQIGLASKVDKVADSALEIGVRALEKVIDKWSTLFLIGYAGQWALSTTITSITNHRSFCSSWYQDLSCLTLSMTTFSYGVCTTATALALAHEVYKLIYEKK
jgi:hypothetical protein